MAGLTLVISKGAGVILLVAEYSERAVKRQAFLPSTKSGQTATDFLPNIKDLKFYVKSKTRKFPPAFEMSTLW